MMRKLLLLLFGLYLGLGTLSAQMTDANGTRYGNEWIRADQSYLKMPITASGMYRLSASQLSAAGWPLSSIDPTQFRLYRNGTEVPIYLSSQTALNSTDYLVFYGQENRGELDRYLFENPDDQLNPAYSIISDTAYYYLTYDPDPANGARYTPLTDPPSPSSTASYWWQEQEQIFSDQALKQYNRIQGTSIYYSHFTPAEGYGSRGDNQLLQAGGTTQEVNMILPNLVADGPPPLLRTRFAGGLGTHQQIIQVADQTVWEGVFPAWEVQQIEAELPSLNAENTLVTFTGQAGDRDEVSLAFVNITYPAAITANGQTGIAFSVAATTEAQRYEVSDFGSEQAVVYDYQNQVRIETSFTNGVITFVLPASAEKRHCWLIDESQMMPISTLQNISFPNLVEPDTDYLILTHAALQGTDPSTDPVTAYAEYRASTNGGSYQTQIVEVADLYEQFAYGQKRNPLALRNFVAYLQEQGIPLQFCLLVGKGREYRDLRTSEDLAAAGPTFFVPSFGYYASDNLMFSPLGSSRPRVAVGRIPALTKEEIQIYLDKVIAQEAGLRMAQQTMADRDWRKHFLHLGGGSSPNEQQIIRNRLESMASEIQQNDFAGQVTSYYKTSTDPLETSQSEQIFNRINAGVSFISFMGHSSAGVFDFGTIDNPDNYDNYAKFPIMFSLGCYSGNMFTSFRSSGERFVFQPNRAALAFGASRGLGFITALGNFGKNFYRLAGEEMYGATIGEMIQANIEHFDEDVSIGIRTLTEQFSLNGDPALRINPAPGPDFITDFRSIEFSPRIVTIQEDSFDLQFRIVNLGQAIQDSFSVLIEQELASGQRLPFGEKRIAVPDYDQIIALRLPTPGAEAVGENRLHITLDIQNDIDESPAPAAELNNRLTDASGREGIAFFVVDNTALPIYPSAFALIAGAPELRASTADALAEEQRYLMELDTTPGFAFPLATISLTQGGGILRWTPEIDWQNEQVYYWRVSPDSIAGSPGFTWETSSFTYFDETDAGWGQSHWGQYGENQLENVEVERFQQLSFVPNIRDFRIKQKVYDPGDQPTGYVNANRWSDFFRWDDHETMQVVVIDSLGRFWFNFRTDGNGEYGSVNTSAARIAAFPFDIDDTANRAELINFLENVIPDGHTVVVYPGIRTVDSEFYEEDWAADSLSLDGRNIFNVLESFGALQIRELENGIRPYLFAFTKGSGPIDEILAADIEDQFNWEFPIPTLWDRGNMFSRLIGPARQWDRLEWEGLLSDANDTLAVELYGIRADGQESILATDLGLAGTYDLSEITASEFPYLKLGFVAKDEVERTIPQLKYWRAYYEGRPDLALDAAAYFSLQTDTLQAGQLARIGIAVDNPSPYAMDTTQLVARLVDAQQRESVQTMQVPALAPGDTVHLDFQIASEALRANTQLSLSLNPSDTPQERYRFNNQAVRDLYLQSDVRQPVLTVTFDGLPIRNGDLVSAQPRVRIELRDENEFLLLNDTSLFLVNLKQPDGVVSRIFLDGNEAVFIPAEAGEDNRAHIEWDPVFLQDGTYELSVRGRDVSGNSSGSLEYQVSFEVITARRLSNVLPYPNPFTTQTRFVYTLTGDETPTEMKIQIMTVSGQIIREITQDELGPLRVGTHQTDFVWNGTDQFGDRLANGVYLYRVVAYDSDGTLFEHHANSTDSFFKNKIGKIVILR